MQQQWDVLVIGAGPGGLSAACTAAENGLEVLLVDEQEMPGGQIYRSVTGKRSAKNFLQKEDRADGLKLVERFLASGAEYAPRHTVWFAEPGRVICSHGGASREIKTQTIIVATGAMERPVPFEGWTLPGVMGAGAADIMYKSAGIVPEGPIVLAGNGPLIPLVGSHLAELGVPIAAVLDTSPFSNKFSALAKMPAALCDVPFLMKGMKMLQKLRAGGVPMHSGVRGLRAYGTDHVAEIGYVVGGSEKKLAAATLLVHEGVIPRTHVSRMLKLEHVWNDVQRYWHPKCDEAGRSSEEGIYIVGDGAAVHGAAASAAKGELAGIDAVRYLKAISDAEAARLSAPAKARLAKALGPRGFVDAYFAPSSTLFDIPDDVLVCRCEGVTAGDIRRAVAEGCCNVNEIKVRTRSGMGPCQSRMCGTALAEIAARALGTDTPALGALNIRPPVRPIPLRELCTFEENS